MYFLYTLSPAYSGFTITSQTGAELLEFRITLEYLGSWISWQRRCRGNFKLPKTHEIELFREVKYYCKNSIFPRRCFGRFERWRERQVLKGLAQLEWIFKELIAFLFTFAASQHRNLKSFWGHKFWGIQVTLCNQNHYLTAVDLCPAVLLSDPSPIVACLFTDWQWLIH